MKLACILAQRSICRTAALRDSKPLTNHLATCADCSRMAGEIRSVEAHIRASIQAPEPSDDFDSRLRARLAAEPILARRASIVRAPVIAGAVAFAACAVLALRLLPAPGARLTGHDDNPANIQVAKQNEPERPASQSTTEKTKAAKRSSAKAGLAKSAPPKRKPRTRQRPVLHLVQSSRTDSQKPASLSPTQIAARWNGWGAYYEKAGDEVTAAEAYRKAHLAMPDPSSAFVAGYAAERAGRITDALDFYAELLDNSATKDTKAEKGAARWTENSLTA